MTLILNNHHHRHPSFIYSNIHSKKFNFTTKLGVKYSCRRANRRLVFTPVNSASVNGYSLRNHDNSPEVSDGVGTDYGEDNAIGVSERLLRFVRLVSSVLPGGNWWRFSDEVEVSVTAKPVTLVRALRRMWGLIANDRWVIFAAFSALILTAVMLSFLFCIEGINYPNNNLTEMRPQLDLNQVELGRVIPIYCHRNSR